jgi:SAM-dependent methyltransferase
MTAWDTHAGWWQRHFTDGADPEYEEQILPLAEMYLDGVARVLDVGCGEGQVARRAARLGTPGCEVWVVGIDPTESQVSVAASRAGGVRYVRGGAERLPFAAATFDAVVICLTLEHLDPFEPAIGEMARVLAPGGRFVCFLNHPLLQAPGSGWVIDHILDEEYWRVGPYLPDDVAMEEVAPGIKLPFMHRPLSRYINEMADHGLLVEHMDEPPPAPGFVAQAPEYAAAATVPRLLALRARKLA